MPTLICMPFSLMGSSRPAASEWRSCWRPPTAWGGVTPLLVGVAGRGGRQRGHSAESTPAAAPRKRTHAPRTPHARPAPLAPRSRAPPDLPTAKLSFEHASELLARLLAPLPLPGQGSQALASLRDKLAQHLLRCARGRGGRRATRNWAAAPRHTHPSPHLQRPCMHAASWGGGWSACWSACARARPSANCPSAAPRRCWNAAPATAARRVRGGGGRGWARGQQGLRRCHERPPSPHAHT